MGVVLQKMKLPGVLLVAVGVNYVKQLSSCCKLDNSDTDRFAIIDATLWHSPSLHVTSNNIELQVESARRLDDGLIS